MLDEEQLPGARTEHGTRERILHAAAELFTEFGYEGTSMAKLANAVGISAPALYWHFNSKEALFYEFMRSTLGAFVERVTGAVTSTRPEERLRQFVMAHVLFHLEDNDAPFAYGRLYSNRQLFTALAPDQRERLVAPQRQVLELLREILHEGEAAGAFDPGHLTVSAFAIITMCEYVFLWFRRDGELTARQVAGQYADRALAMVVRAT